MLRRLTLALSLASLLPSCAPTEAAALSSEAPPSSVVVTAGAAPVQPAPSAQPAASASASAPAPLASSPAAPADSAPAEAAPGPRIGALGKHVYVYAHRSRKVQVGHVQAGTAIALKGTAPQQGEGCKGPWHEVLPAGFVCGDATTTLDLSNEAFRALSLLVGHHDRPLPYGYAYSTGAPMYGKLPTVAEQKRAERKYRSPDKLVRPRKPSGHAELASGAEPPKPSPVPPYLEGGKLAPALPFQHPGLVKKDIREGNMLAFTASVEGEGGRLFLLATNLAVVPADRVWVYRPSEFHGVAVGKGEGALQAPLGWSRRKPVPRHKVTGDRLEPAGDPLPPRTAIALGKAVEVGGEPCHETLEKGVVVRDRDLSVLDAEAELPKGIEPGERWIDVGLSSGLLTLYEDKKPVYSTLMSPGAGGTTQSASLTIDQLLSGAFTPLGVYRIAFKYRSAIMTPEDGPDPEKTWIDEVPWTMYFRPPYAIHSAYWHEDFGHPKSGGCVNLSPIDARHVFDWTGPHLPPGWHGVGDQLPGEVGTKIHIHR